MSMRDGDFTLPQMMVLIPVLAGLTIAAGVCWLIAKVTGKAERPLIDWTWR